MISWTKFLTAKNTRINGTLARLHRSDNFNESSKYTWVKKTDSVEIDALFGLVYFRGILGVNLHMTDRLFSNDSHFFLFLFLFLFLLFLV